MYATGEPYFVANNAIAFQGALEVCQLDLADLTSVRACAEKLK